MIQLTKGKTTVVNEDDREWLEKHRWKHLNRPGYQGYAVRNAYINKRYVALLMHRAIWEHHNGPIPKGMQIDHINGDTLDNRLENLRICTNAQNAHNSYKRRQTASRYKGVTWHIRYKKWVAQIGRGKNHRHIGYFTSEEDAARAYDAKARELWGEFAHLNFD